MRDDADVAGLTAPARTSGTPRSARRTGRWGAPAILVGAYLVAMILLGLSALIDVQNARTLEETGARVSQTIEATERLRTVGNTVYIAESAQRGYLLTGNTDYLVPFRDMQGRLPGRLLEMDRAVIDTPVQRATAAELRTSTLRRFETLERQVDAHAAAAGNDPVDLGDDVDGLAPIRGLINRMLQEESRVLAERRALAADAYAGVLTRALISTAVVALALTAFYLLMHRYLGQRDTALRIVEESNAALEQRVSERTVALSSLSRHLLHVREEERKIIARDLHDDFGSYLTAINMDVSRTRDKIATTNPELAAKLERTLGLLNRSIDMKRRLISDLRPSLLDNLGLGPALEQYIEEWAPRAHVAASFDHQGDMASDGDGDGAPIAIFRIFQEALSNVARHAQATKVAAYAYRSGDEIEFEIADNGVGIADADRGKPGANGLIGIRERVLAYEGRLEIVRGAPGGTIIRGAIPYGRTRDERPVTLGMLQD